MRYVCIFLFCTAISICVLLSGCNGGGDANSPLPATSEKTSLAEEQIGAGEQFAETLQSRYRQMDLTSAFGSTISIP